MIPDALRLKKKSEAELKIDWKLECPHCGSTRIIYNRWKKAARCRKCGYKW